MFVSLRVRPLNVRHLFFIRYASELISGRGSVFFSSGDMEPKTPYIIVPSVSIAGNYRLHSVLKLLQRDSTFGNKSKPVEHVELLKSYTIDSSTEKPSRKILDQLLIDFSNYSDFFVTSPDLLSDVLCALADLKLEPIADVSPDILQRFLIKVESIILDVFSNSQHSEAKKATNVSVYCYVVSVLSPFFRTEFSTKFWPLCCTATKVLYPKFTGEQLTYILTGLATAPLNPDPSLMNALFLRISEAISAGFYQPMHIPDILLPVSLFARGLLRHENTFIDLYSRNAGNLYQIAYTAIQPSLGQFGAVQLSTALKACIFPAQIPAPILNAEWYTLWLRCASKIMHTFASSELCNVVMTLGVLFRQRKEVLKSSISTELNQELESFMSKFFAEFLKRQRGKLLQPIDIYKAARGMILLDHLLSSNRTLTDNLAVSVDRCALSAMGEFRASHLFRYGLVKAQIHAQNFVSPEPSWFLTWLDSCAGALKDKPYNLYNLHDLLSAFVLFELRDDAVLKLLSSKLHEKLEETVKDSTLKQLDMKNFAFTILNFVALNLSPTPFMWSVVCDKLHECTKGKILRMFTYAVCSEHLRTGFSHQMLVQLQMCIYERWEALLKGDLLTVSWTQSMLMWKSALGDQAVVPKELMESVQSQENIAKLHLDAASLPRSVVHEKMKAQLLEYLDRKQLKDAFDVKEMRVLENGLVVPLTLQVKRSSSAAKDCLVIMQDRPYDYYRSKYGTRTIEPGNLIASRQMTYKLLEKCGYEVLRVPWYIENDKDFGGMGKYLDGVLDPHCQRLLLRKHR